MIDSQPTLLARTLDSIRYRSRLGLIVLLAGSVASYLCVRSLNQCFQSSVVVIYPLPPHDPLLPTPPGQAESLLESVRKSPEVHAAFLQSDSVAPLIANLGSRPARSFFESHLAFATLPTSLHDSIPLSVTAKESNPLAVQGLARSVGQAILHQASASQPKTTHLLPTPLPAIPPPAIAAAPPLPAPHHLNNAPPLNSEAMERRKFLTDDLITAEDRRSHLAEELTALDALERTQSVRPPPVRSFNEATLRTQVSESRATLNDLEKRYTEQHPDVVAEKERLHDLQTRLDQAIAHDEATAREQAAQQANSPAVKTRVARQAEIRPELTHLNAQVADDTAEIDKLSLVIAAEAAARQRAAALDAAQDAAQVATLNAQSAAQPPVQAIAPATQNAKTPDRAAESAEVRQLTQRVQDYLKNPAAAPQAADSQVAVPAPSEPTFPSPSTFVPESVLAATSLLLGLLAAILSVLVSEIFSSSIKSGRNLEKELPAAIEFVGEFPRIAAHKLSSTFSPELSSRMTP